jgi:hypothetical protein
MGYEMSVVFVGSYVEVRSRGDKSYQTAVALWAEITRVCNQSDCYRILGIAESTTAMPIMDSVKHEKLLADFAVTRKYKIAWVELNPEAIGNVKFLETFLTNRGLVNGRLFRDVDEARRWLLDD